MKSTTSLFIFLSAVLIFLAINPPAFSELVSEWKFDGDGSNEVPMRPSAVPQGDTVFYSEGGVDGGFAHIPANADHVRIPDSSFFHLPVSFTVMFWFRQYNDQGFYNDFLNKNCITPLMSNYRIYRLGGGGKIRASYTGADSGAWVSAVEADGPFEHGRWHHVAYTKSADTHDLYINGLPWDTTEVVEDARTDDSPLIIGKFAVNTDMDELRIYDRALTAKQIARYYNRYVTAFFSTCEEECIRLGSTGDWQCGLYAWTGVNCTDPSSPPPEPHSGSHMWGTILNGCYNNLGNNSGFAECENDVASDDSIVAFLVDLGGMSTATLTWWEWFDVYQPFDWAEVYVNDNVVYQYCSPNYHAPDCWRFKSVDLTPYVGNSVVISFHMMASTVNNRGGWWLDDLLILGKSSLSDFLPSIFLLLD